MKKFLILFLIISFFFIWQGIYLPKDSEIKESRLFLVQKGENLFQISENLEKENLIKNSSFFNLYILIKGSQRKLQAGEYLFSPSMNVAQITKKIISGDTIKTKITLIEGWTLIDIGQYLEEKGVVSKAKDFYGLNSPLMKIDFSQEFNFLEDKPKNISLEGYIFPDTYEISHEMDLEEIIREILDNFDKKLTDDLREEITRQEKTIFEIVTMASLLEKEVKIKEDKEIVSGILWKRRDYGMPLQVDATITYITGKQTIKVSKEDTEIDSPYNTYKYLGLPLGPICNPGLESIQAALYPEGSKYWYYLSTPEGETIFNETLEEHNYDKSKYLK